MFIRQSNTFFQYNYFDTNEYCHHQAYQHLHDCSLAPLHLYLCSRHSDFNKTARLRLEAKKEKNKNIP